MKHLALILMSILILFLWTISCYMCIKHGNETYGVIFIPTMFFTLCYFVIVNKLFDK